jgi:hypothetical protein
MRSVSSPINTLLNVDALADDALADDALADDASAERSDADVLSKEGIACGDELHSS